jgi:tetratricopeptide (TPR) repeat protein
VLDGQPSAVERSLALHALTIVARDSGRISEALALARAAVTASRAAGPEREAELRATFGTTLLFAGETTKALAQLDKALQVARGQAVARVLHLKGCTFWLLGRYPEALDDLTRSLEESRRLGDRLWEGRALASRADVFRAMGEAALSAVDYAEAEAVLTDIGEDLEAILAVRRQAQVAAQQGDVVSALTLIEETEERYQRFGLDPVEQLIDHAMALLAARLAGEAQDLVQQALSRADLAPVWRADLLMASARAALLTKDWDGARRQAEEAATLFRGHRRHRWAARAQLLSLEAAYADLRPLAPDGAAPLTARLVSLERQVRGAVERLRELADPGLAEGLLLFAEVTRDAGHPVRSRRALEEAAKARNRGTPLSRAAGWLASAMLAADKHDRRQLRYACRRGLDAVDEHRGVIGDLELRALATGYGAEFAELAVLDAVRHNDALGVLWWTERWRATSLTGIVRPPEDPDLRRDIAALRDVSRRLDIGGDDPALARERGRLEAAVRHRYRHLSSTGREGPPLDLPRLLQSLDDMVLVYVLRVMDHLQAVTVIDGRARLQTLGHFETAFREAQYARFTLRRAAFGRSVDLDTAARRLQHGLFYTLKLPADRPVLVVPPASLLTAPYGLVPELQDTVVTVSPSLTLWKRAAATGDRHGGPQSVVLVVGPGLSTEGREVAELAPLHRRPVVVAGSEATVENALGALSGAGLAHIAAHGTFRADAPQFSSLTLVDGPLMMHDLDRLDNPPASVVLSACDSGGVHPIGADEALGLVTSLLAMGTSTVLASVVPVNDRATLSVMRQVHRVTAQGASLAAGLHRARRESTGDPLLKATAASFNTWGA